MPMTLTTDAELFDLASRYFMNDPELGWTLLRNLANERGGQYQRILTLLIERGTVHRCASCQRLVQTTCNGCLYADLHFDDSNLSLDDGEHTFDEENLCTGCDQPMLHCVCVEMASYKRWQANPEGYWTP